MRLAAIVALVSGNGLFCISNRRLGPSIRRKIIILPSRVVVPVRRHWTSLGSLSLIIQLDKFTPPLHQIVRSKSRKVRKIFTKKSLAATSCEKPSKKDPEIPPGTKGAGQPAQFHHPLAHRPGKQWKKVSEKFAPQGLSSQALSPADGVQNIRHRTRSPQRTPSYFAASNNLVPWDRMLSSVRANVQCAHGGEDATAF